MIKVQWRVSHASPTTRLTWRLLRLIIYGLMNTRLNFTMTESILWVLHRQNYTNSWTSTHRPINYHRLISGEAKRSRYGCTLCQTKWWFRSGLCMTFLWCLATLGASLTSLSSSLPHCSAILRSSLCKLRSLKCCFTVTLGKGGQHLLQRWKPSPQSGLLLSHIASHS